MKLNKKNSVWKYVAKIIENICITAVLIFFIKGCVDFKKADNDWCPKGNICVR